MVVCPGLNYSSIVFTKCTLKPQKCSCFFQAGLVFLLASLGFQNSKFVSIIHDSYIHTLIICDWTDQQCQWKWMPFEEG